MKKEIAEMIKIAGELKKNDKDFFMIYGMMVENKNIKTKKKR